MPPSKADIFWTTHDEDEPLLFETLDEAIALYVDSEVPVRSLLPGAQLTVYGFEREKMIDVPEMIEQLAPLENVLDVLDGIYSPEVQSEVTEAMRAAEREFVEKIRALYEVRVVESEPTHTKTVDVYAWAREHRPEACVPDASSSQSGVFQLAAMG